MPSKQSELSICFSSYWLGICVLERRPCTVEKEEGGGRTESGLGAEVGKKEEGEERKRERRGDNGGGRVACSWSADREEIEVVSPLGFSRECTFLCQ